MLQNFSGATRVFPVIGDPIAQVKSPFGVTAAFEQRGADAICVPMQVAADDFPAFAEAMWATKNVDGLIITVPHKFSAFGVCDDVSKRASFLKSVNTMRRNGQRGWSGDMFDGLGFVAACQDNGCEFLGKKALLAGAGGAGTAIAHAIAEAGVAQLTIADLNIDRRDDLICRLAAAGYPVIAGDPCLDAHDIVCNATPMGMKPSDPMPVNLHGIHSGIFAGDVVTMPEVPPFIAAARSAGCRTSNGVAMFEKVRDLMVDYLINRP